MADPFDTDKGVKGDYNGVITDAAFVANNQGRTQLVLTIVSEDPDDKGEEVENQYNVGNEWASFDGGATVEHATKRLLRADSQVATLVERAMKCDPDAEKVIRQRSAENNDLAQKTAALWPGTSWYWEVEEKPYEVKDRETGETSKGTSYKAYPTRFNGVRDGVSTDASTGGDNEPVDIPPDILAKIKVLAQSKPFAEWVDEMLTIDWMRENMLSALGDEAFYNSLKE